MKPTNSYLFQRYLYIHAKWLYEFLFVFRMVSAKRAKAGQMITESFLFVPLPEHTVRITWLPNNHITEPNAYIGMEGEAQDIKPDGSFVLKGRTNSLIVGTKYAFEYINSTEYFNK